MSKEELMLSALKQVTENCEEGDTGADFERVVAAMKVCSEAIEKVKATNGE
jgi:hypothetical protein